MLDHSHHVRLLRDLAGTLEAEPDPTDDLFTPHRDTQAILNTRRTGCGQLNYAVSETLQLQRRVHRYNLDSGIPHGDVVALALDALLRAEGYPPERTAPSEK
ncbi:hypothetical protein [Streptomyces sasae]|uniref:hypothetical protein n=1 Tax=Streptomyces sasae TaxID=1266772 RepID=UPI00292E8764|nr:hypothetical protein [Streptomyces sasae]